MTNNTQEATVSDMHACDDCGRIYPSTRAAMLCCDEEYRGDRYPE